MLGALPHVEDGMLEHVVQLAGTQMSVQQIDVLHLILQTVLAGTPKPAIDGLSLPSIVKLVILSILEFFNQ